jgi:hypothetical protein
MSNIDAGISRYLSEIGRKGGRKSRRALSSETARDMVRVRESRKAFRDYYAQCFWYMRRDMNITIDDIPEIVRGLRQNGGRQGFLLATRLCR